LLLDLRRSISSSYFFPPLRGYMRPLTNLLPFAPQPASCRPDRGVPVDQGLADGGGPVVQRVGVGFAITKLHGVATRRRMAFGANERVFVRRDHRPSCPVE